MFKKLCVRSCVKEIVSNELCVLCMDYGVVCKTQKSTNDAKYKYHFIFSTELKILKITEVSAFSS